LEEIYSNIRIQKKFMGRKIDEKRHQELLKQKEELENNRPHDIDAMRRWKHSMGKILEELELFKK
jgi:hypothetical protein